MTNSFYQGYVAFHTSPGGRSSDPEWLAGYDQAYEDDQQDKVNSEVYYKFHGRDENGFSDES